MTDFHSHLLPGMDDGSDSVSTSLRMLDMWREQGRVDRICATSHFYAEHNTPKRFLAKRQAAYEALLEATEDIGDIPEILLGAEVRFFDGVSSAEDLPKLCLQGTNLLLLEMPFVRWTDRMLAEVERISRRGLQPVAAHLERYFRFNSGRTIEEFLDMDVLIQCNAEFFVDRRTSRKAIKLLKEERIHFLGSDAHNTDSRPPQMAAALEKIEHKLGSSAIRRLQRQENLYLGERGRIPV